MFKITAIVSLLIIGDLLVSGLSCDSCGSECAAACGTRHFRSCCFNYLRRKRDPDTFKFVSHDLKMGRYHKEPHAAVTVEEIPERWMYDIPSGRYKPYYLHESADKLDSTYDL